MADIRSGWLKFAGEKFYAHTNARSVRITDTQTLADILDKFDTDEILSNMRKLQEQFDKLQQNIDVIYDQVGVYNIQTGVYTITREELQPLIDNNKLDDNVLYIVTEDSTLISRVAIKVIWKTPTGETLESETFVGDVGTTSSIDIPFYRRIFHHGITYAFTPAASPILDMTTGNNAKFVDVPGDPNATVAKTYFTKNVIVELRAKEV